MFRAILILMAIVLIIPAVCAAVEPATTPTLVTLRPQAEVAPAQYVTLGEIADIEAPQDTIARISNITVGTGPLPGRSNTISADYVRVKLRAAGLNDASVQINGAVKVQIVGRCVTLTPEDLAEEAKSFLTGCMSLGDANYNIVVDRYPKKIVLPQGSDVTISPKLMSVSAQPGVNTVGLDILLNGSIAATTSAVLSVKAVLDVMVATTTISQGEPLTEANTTWEKHEITNQRDIITRNEYAQHKDWIARRSIPTGVMITTASVAIEPTIHRGDAVSIVVKCGNVTLQTTGEAKQDGKKGDMIRVLSAISQSNIDAKVIEAGLVEMSR
ncbi:MAG: flagellar basal body P-ring formation chaperone FlgA [Armatimonadota bacterium]|nr:flagellar basal body P-ring formation chaperone FlgA [bacterium]